VDLKLENPPTNCSDNEERFSHQLAKLSHPSGRSHLNSRIVGEKSLNSIECLLSSFRHEERVIRRQFKRLGACKKFGRCGWRTMVIPAKKIQETLGFTEVLPHLLFNFRGRSAAQTEFDEVIDAVAVNREQFITNPKRILRPGFAAVSEKSNKECE
jgi:hypothetical protein